MKQEKYNNRTPHPAGPAHRHAEIEALIARYFEAETTGSEERQLRHFLCSPEGQDARYDEVRAVMGFTAAGRALHRQVKPEAPRRARRRTLHRRLGAIAACLTAICLTGPAIRTYQRMAGTNGVEGACVAYIDGQRFTDEEIVLRSMHHSMSEIIETEGAPSMEQQLGLMFNASEQE